MLWRVPLTSFSEPVAHVPLPAPGGWDADAAAGLAARRRRVE